MIEKLQKGEFRERVIAEKINELIDVFNSHYHMTVDCNTQGTGDIEKGFYSSTPRVEPIGTQTTEQLTESLKEKL